MSEDMRNSADTLNIRMTDESAFRVGDNIATSKGKVVFENYLMQLIQYEPSTEKVKQRPMLLVPPWINKFYIMDLREKNSFIRWAVEQGHTVFVLSWANPAPEYNNVSMKHYMKDGVLAGMDAIERITGEKDHQRVWLLYRWYVDSRYPRLSNRQKPSRPYRQCHIMGNYH